MFLNPDKVPSYLKGLYCRFGEKGSGAIGCQMEGGGICGCQQFCSVVGSYVLSKQSASCNLRNKGLTVNK